MPLFKQKKCVCGLNTVGVGIEPNPAGEFFCPRCGRELIPIERKGKATTEPEPEPEPASALEPPAEP